MEKFMHLSKDLTMQEIFEQIFKLSLARDDVSL
jgi:hypothetical protein